MNFLEVVTPPSIYHGCYTQETLWEEKFTPVNMKICGHNDFRKHKEINNSDQYSAFEIYLGIDGLNKREVTSSGSVNYVGRSGKGLNISLALSTRMR